MSEWATFSLSQIATMRKGISYTSSDYGVEDSGHPFITIKCFVKGGGYEPTGTNRPESSSTTAFRLRPTNFQQAMSFLPQPT